jgi:hypothetical protein
VPAAGSALGDEANTLVEGAPSEAGVAPNEAATSLLDMLEDRSEHG